MDNSAVIAEEREFKGINGNGKEYNQKIFKRHIICWLKIHCFLTKKNLLVKQKLESRLGWFGPPHASTRAQGRGPTTCSQERNEQISNVIQPHLINTILLFFSHPRFWLWAGVISCLVNDSV